MLIKWEALQNQYMGQKTFEIFNYSDYLDIFNEFKNLSIGLKKNYKGFDDFYYQTTNNRLSLEKQKYLKIIQEASARLDNTDVPEVLTVDTMVDGDIVMELLQSLENESHIKNTYCKKKCLVRDGINTSTANRLLECMRQGRSLLQAGKKADVLAKPLIDFYAANAYSYALIVIYSPLHKSLNSLKGSHGHTYNHIKSSVDFGGEIPTGTFMDLINAFSVATLNSSNINLKYSLVNSMDYIQQHSISLSLITLLSMVPELSSYYEPLKLKKSIHTMSIDTDIVNSDVRYNFYIGNGIEKPSEEKLRFCFPNGIINENHGAYKISVSSDALHKISPIIYKDIRGKLWYVEAPINGLYLPEICLHYLIVERRIVSGTVDRLYSADIAV